MNIVTGMMRKIEGKDGIDAGTALGGFVKCWQWFDKKKCDSTQNGRARCSNGTLRSMNRTTRMRKMIGEEHQKLSSRLISSAEGGADLLHQNPNSMER